MTEDKENQNTQENQEIPDKTPEERAEARLSKVPTDEFKAFMEQEYGAGSFEKHYLNAPAEEKDRLETQFEAKFKKEPLREAKEVKINEGEMTIPTPINKNPKMRIGKKNVSKHGRLMPKNTNKSVA